jgi:drug efflux transport system permease protein
MNPGLRAQVIKELLSFLRDPKMRLVLVGPPLMQLLLFSFAVTLEVRHIDLAVFNEDAGRSSYELIARVGASSFVDEIITVGSAAQLADLINRRRVLAALHIPADFSRDVAAGRTARAQLLLDGRRGNSGQIASGYLGAVVAAWGGEIRSLGAGGEVRPGPAAPISVRNWFNPNLTYRWFVVPSLAGMLAMMISLLITSLSIAREREMGTFDQLLVSPASPTQIIVGKMLPGLIIGSALSTLMVAAGAFGFRIPFTGSFMLLLICMVVFILSVVGLGLMVSSVCDTQQQAILGVFALAVPIVLISGFATPVENMPRVLQLAAEASPLKHFLIIAQGSFLKALPLKEVLRNLWPLLVIAAVTLSAAVLIVKRRLQ